LTSFTGWIDFIALDFVLSTGQASPGASSLSSTQIPLRILLLLLLLLLLVMSIMLFVSPVEVSMLPALLLLLLPIQVAFPMI